MFSAISSSSLDTHIPTSKAVYNFVTSKIENNGSNESSNTGTGGGLPEVFYVETFAESPEVSGLYINHDGETRFWNGNEWEYTSQEIIDEIKLENNDLVTADIEDDNEAAIITRMLLAKVRSSN